MGLLYAVSLLTVPVTGSELKADVVNGYVFVEEETDLDFRCVSIEWQRKFSLNSVIRIAATDEDTLVPRGSVL